jgi:hypothetical protein
VAAAGAPPTGDIDVASLYPNIDTTKHVVMEIIEPNFAQLHSEQAMKNGGHMAMMQASIQAKLAAEQSTAAPGTVLTITPESLSADTASSQSTQPPFPDAQALAESLAASAGPDMSKDPADYLAVATAYTTGGTAPPPGNTTAGFLNAEPHPTVGVVSETTTPETGRKLLQGNVVQDVLMVYTPAAASGMSGAANAENQIRIAIADTNKAYTDSGIALTLNIVGIRQVRALSVHSESLCTLHLSTSTVHHGQLWGTADQVISGLLPMPCGNPCSLHVWFETL